jgi:hypothetical protein
MFKKKKKTLPSAPTDYPTGICVKTEAGYWYINGKFRHPFKSDRLVQSWNFSFIAESTEAALSHYLKGKPLGYRDGSLVCDIADGKTYLISSKTRRLITKPETYDLLGLKRSDAIWAARDEINLHPEGEVL